MRILASLALVFLTTFCSAQQVEVVEVVRPKPFVFSHNIVFVVDASSTINLYPEAKEKFNKAWDIIVNQFASDELYFRTYVFHDSDSESRTDWVDAGGPWGLKEFHKAKTWVVNNTGMYSWGLKCLRWAFRDKNPLDKNPATNKRLTIILMTDGGFTEAADYSGGYDEDEVLAATFEDHIYSRTGSFDVITKTIASEQALRKLKGWEPAVIVTIGLENTAADKQYGNGVKRRDPECQAWLKMIGKKYQGGYYLVKKKKKKRKNKRVS